MRKLLLTLCLIGNLAHAAEIIDRIVAVVNDDVVLLSELGREAQELTRQLQGSNTQPMPARDQILSTALDRLILDKLQLAEARRQGITIAPEEVTRTTMQVSQQNNLSLLRFRSKLAEEGVDYDQFQQHIQDRLTINRLINRAVVSQIQVTKTEVEQQLAQQGDQQPTSAPVNQIRARHILLRTNNKTNDQAAQQKLQELRDQIVAGGDFAALARSYSADQASAIKGGDLGWANPSDMVPTFAQQLQKTPVDQVSQPFKTKFGWHIVQVLGQRVHDDSATKARQYAQETIRNRKVEEARVRYLQRLRSEAHIEVRADDS